MTHIHVVEFYDTESALASCVENFMAPALLAGRPAIVVATPEHRRLFETAFLRSGIDIVTAAQSGLFVALDAQDTMSRFMSDGLPDPVRFCATVGKLVADTRGSFSTIYIYGEMVALLWASGNAAGALALEELWNELAGQQPFVLLCAYPISLFDLDVGSAGFWHICECHTDSRVGVGDQELTRLFDPPRPARI